MDRLRFVFTRRQSAPENPFSPFMRLPVEIRLKIFSFLTPAQLGLTARVSKEWYQISKDPTLWKSICFEFGKKKKRLRSVEFFTKIVNSFPDVAQIETVDTMCNDVPNLLLHLGELTPSLKSLSAAVVGADPNLQLESLKPLMSNQLTSIKLKFEVTSPNRPIDDGLNNLLHGQDRVKCLEIYNCDIRHRYTTSLLRKLLLTKLVSFGIHAANWPLDDYELLFRRDSEGNSSFCRLESILVPTHLNDSIIYNIAELTRKTLKEVKVMGLYAGKDSPNRLTDNGIVYLLKQCRRLKSLQVTYDRILDRGIAFEFRSEDRSVVVEGGAKLEGLELNEVKLQPTGLTNLTKMFGSCLTELTVIHESGRLSGWAVIFETPDLVWDLGLFPNLVRLHMVRQNIFYKDPDDVSLQLQCIRTSKHKNLRRIKLKRCLILRGTTVEEGCNVGSFADVTVDKDFPLAACDLDDLDIYLKDEDCDRMAVQWFLLQRIGAM